MTDCHQIFNFMWFVTNYENYYAYFETFNVMFGATKSSALGDGRLLKNPSLAPFLPDEFFLDWLW